MNEHFWFGIIYGSLVGSAITMLIWLIANARKEKRGLWKQK